MNAGPYAFILCTFNLYTNMYIWVWAESKSICVECLGDLSVSRGFGDFRYKNKRGLAAKDQMVIFRALPFLNVNCICRSLRIFFISRFTALSSQQLDESYRCDSEQSHLGFLHHIRSAYWFFLPERHRKKPTRIHWKVSCVPDVYCETLTVALLAITAQLIPESGRETSLLKLLA